MRFAYVYFMKPEPGGCVPSSHHATPATGADSRFAATEAAGSPCSTAGADLEPRHQFWRYLRKLHGEEGLTVLLTTHYIEEAEALCERVALMRAGRIVAEGTPDELVERFWEGSTLGFAARIVERAHGSWLEPVFPRSCPQRLQRTPRWIPARRRRGYKRTRGVT